MEKTASRLSFLCFVSCFFLLFLSLANAQDCAYTGCHDANARCCSKWGYCGDTGEHCDPAQGCVSGCWPVGAATSETGVCKTKGCKYNTNGRCCGSNGNCGSTAAQCDPKQGCVSGCWTASDGCKLNGCPDPNYKCCSKWGYCGNTAAWCAVDQGCVSGCWPATTTYSQTVTNCKISGCPSNSPCCSTWGYCGNTAAFCDKGQGCVSGCWSGNSSSLVSQLVHTAFVSNTRSAAWWPTARTQFFNVIDQMYNLAVMSGVKAIWTTQKSKKATSESTDDPLWLGNTADYIDNVIPKVTDKAMIDLLKVLSMSAKRLAATKPQECGAKPESSTFCKLSLPVPTQATIPCTRYNCFFNPGVPCITRKKAIGRCSDPTFFTSNAIKCPAMGCTNVKKRTFDSSVLEKRQIARSFFTHDILRRRLKKELRTYLQRRDVSLGDSLRDERRGFTTRATCVPMSCESCGISSSTFTDSCSAQWNGMDMCCMCAYDFGPINSF
eukprot:TRINITY_DN3_c0_g1_i5.p1 TRINITY_DN3_c0_g1~~TRINITY_DN3_c0_g1_i5.p1  ORF type:complete len:494 (+),score=73.41 TRINITY_DN3_c0_g1_i5:43-1524(+)